MLTDMELSRLQVWLGAFVLVVTARHLIWLVSETRRHWVRVAGCMGLFVCYVSATLMLVVYFAGGAATVEECIARACAAVVISSAAALLFGGILYGTSGKKDLSESEKMRLRDL